MAKTTLPLVWNTKILSPLNADHESLESKTVKISWLLKKIKLLNKPYFFERENNSSVLTFSWIPKSKMMSHNCLWTCIASLYSKLYDWMLNGTFSSWKETVKIIDRFHTFHKRENNSSVLTFSRIPKSKMMSHNCLWTCIAIIAFKTVRLDVKMVRFLVESRLLR